MTSHEYNIEETESGSPEQPKPRMTISEKDYAGITKKRFGDKLSMLVSGRVCEIREGYGKDKTPEVSIEITKIDDKEMKGEEDAKISKD